MKCKKHPKYKVIKKPREDCLDCWKMYAEKLEIELKNAVIIINQAGRKIFKIDVGNMPTDRAIAFINNIKNEII